jgi:hypothetical protein
MTGAKTTPTYDELLKQSYVGLGLDETGGRAKKAPKGDPEHQLQKALIARIRVWDKHANGGKGAWVPQPLALKYPDLMDLYAVPNGGKRGIVTATKMKAEGVLSGVLDLSLDVPMRKGAPAITYANVHWHGLRLETKVPGSYPTPEQRVWMQRLVERGYAVAVWRTLDEGVGLLVRYMSGQWEQKPEMLK